jgi:regulator of protease activity HflC (stomatin/prohibitin superfamily)
MNVADLELTTNSPTTPQKRWGWVSARPSEYLVVFRRGRIVEKLCGQGARFFKRPSDSYAVVPTTLKEVVFQANQVTVDHVDVRVRGMVVYRISQPLQIYKLINFVDRAGAEAKLARVIADMCRGVAKWLVANITLEECVRRRKEEIAAQLRAEVQAVASASWGVEIVAMDVLDVYVQDGELFKSMLAGFKSEKDREAKLVQLASSSAIEAQRLSGERALEKDRQELALEKAQRDAQLELARLELVRKKEEQQFVLDRARETMKRELELARVAAGIEQARLVAEGRRERARIRAEARALAHDEELRFLRERLVIESAAGPASLQRLYVTDALPKIADAVGKSLQNARLTVLQGEGGGGFVPLAVSQVLDLLGDNLKK